ncbi:MAG: class I SAM-dependent methyltransferase [Nitrospira sp.]|nr:class I SAM-dependent methyltransferase [Nitrospira sp.]
MTTRDRLGPVLARRDAAAAPSPAGTPASPQAAWRVLHRAASEPYRAGGRFALHFARGKLGFDPVFRALLERGAITPGARVLDIGCGQALLASLLAQCQAAATAGLWPTAWGPAPTHTRYTGIDLLPRDIERAECALAGLSPPPQLHCGDMRRLAFGPCDVAVLLDVLHYVDHAAQHDVLLRVRQALAPHGRLLLRVGDAAQVRRFRISQWVDHAVTRVRGHRVPPTWGRTLPQWRDALHALGFHVIALPMSGGTPFANMLLVCNLAPAEPEGAAR